MADEPGTAPEAPAGEPRPAGSESAAGTPPELDLDGVDPWAAADIREEGEDLDEDPVVYGEDDEGDGSAAESAESGLRERFQKATGALPQGLLLKAGGAVAVLAGALVYLTIGQRQAALRPSPDAVAEQERQETIETAQVPADTVVSDVAEAISQRVEQERGARRERVAREQQAEIDRQRQQLQRIQEEARQAQGDLLRQQAGLPATDPYAGGMIDAPLGLTTETEAIQAWREQQRIEELQREARAPWADPLALDLTDDRPAGPPPPAPPQSPANRILSAAEDTQSALERVRQELIEQQLGGTAAAAAPPPAGGPPAAEPAAIVVAGKGRGNRVIREGSLLPAILTTALDSRAPGPAIAMISRPVHSRDRLEVLIPRGAKALGSFSVQGRRLAVNFRTLQFQDGRSVALGMQGLDPGGSAGLADSVNMHYAQRIGAVGLIGLLTAIPQALVGRSSRGSPYGLQGISTVGQQVGTVGTQALQPMIGRLPTIRVRPGSAIRIYIQNDLTIP